MKVAKEGFGVMAAIFLFGVVLFAGALITGNKVLLVFAIFSLLLFIFSLYFFRDPEREKPSGNNYVLSPADGKVIKIETTEENDFFNSKVKLVSIFMSIFSVHVNRIPISGKVVYFNYKKGAFLQAFKDEATYVNEQTIIGIENNDIKVLYKQIAGIIARRIVCNLYLGREVIQGERFGMIKFGSRVDIFLPESVEVKVALNEKVTAGKTIIGTY